jgi:hypothetical protein
LLLGSHSSSRLVDDFLACDRFCSVPKAPISLSERFHNEGRLAFV